MDNTVTFPSHHFLLTNYEAEYSIKNVTLSENVTLHLSDDFIAVQIYRFI